MQNNYKAKKTLGQNFLKSKEALRAMLHAGEIQPKDIVLEVGPGKGVLTEALLLSGAKVFAVEKDDRMIAFLSDKFRKEISLGQLTLIHGDILEFDPSFYKLQTIDYKLVANIPYYITGTFLRKFLSENFQPEKMVIMLQKEVAKRIVAQNKKESILSLSVKAYGTPKYIMTVHKKYFSPSPNVDSAILLIENISKDFFNTVSEEKFFELIKKAFSQKRKLLLNNLPTSKERGEKILEEIGIPRLTRSEDLTLLDFKKILESLESRN